MGCWAHDSYRGLSCNSFYKVNGLSLISATSPSVYVSAPAIYKSPVIYTSHPPTSQGKVNLSIATVDTEICYHDETVRPKLNYLYRQG